MSQIITNLTSLPILHSGVSGRFRGILRDLMGRTVQDTGWFDNLILDSGLPILGTPWWSRMYVGSNGTASNVSMTGIQTFIPGGQASISGVNGNAVGLSPNYETSIITSCRFDKNEATGTIREFGIGISIDFTGNDCVARQVVTPEIVKGPDNILDLFYDFTHWPALGQQLANGVLIGTETYNTVTTSSDLGGSSTCYPYRTYGFTQPQYYYTYDGTSELGPITGTPTGISDTSGSGVTYGSVLQNGAEWYRDVTYFTDIDNGNFVEAGVGASIVRHENNLYYQTSFKADGNGTLPVGSPIPKNDTNEIDLTYRTYWGRYTP